MRILICHGYQLRGAGGNQYVQSLARSFCARGHQVLLMCQESDPRLDFVSSFVRETGGAVELAWEQETAFPGHCMVVQPDIAGLLPVYTLDACPGFLVKEFVELEAAELDRYVKMNRSSLERLVRQFVPDGIHVNHALVFPFVVRPIAGERGVPYFVSVHPREIESEAAGEARYLEYGARGLEGAAAIFAPGEDTRIRVLEVFGAAAAGLAERLEVLAPGVDTAVFRPAEEGFRRSVERMLEAVDERMAGVTVADFRGGSEARGAREPLNVEREIERINTLHPDRMPEAGMAERLLELADGKNPFFAYTAGLHETGGVQCIVPALPLLLAERPAARLLVVGSGEFRGLLELMIEALDAGELKTFRLLCDYGNSASPSSLRAPFAPVLEFLDALEAEGSTDSYARLCMGTDIAAAMIFTGYLRPEEYSLLLPHCRAALVPSLAGESSRTAAIEAMASGVTPLVSDIPALRSAAEQVEESWGKDAGRLLLDGSERMVLRIAASCRTVTDMTTEQLALRGEEMRREAERRFGWEATADRLLEAYEAAAR